MLAENSISKRQSMTTKTGLLLGKTIHQIIYARCFCPATIYIEKSLAHIRLSLLYHLNISQDKSTIKHRTSGLNTIPILSIYSFRAPPLRHSSRNPAEDKTLTQIPCAALPGCARICSLSWCCPQCENTDPERIQQSPVKKQRTMAMFLNIAMVPGILSPSPRPGL